MPAKLEKSVQKFNTIFCSRARNYIIYRRCFTFNNAVECAANIVEVVRDIIGLFAFAGTKVAHYLAASSLALLCLSSTLSGTVCSKCGGSKLHKFENVVYQFHVSSRVKHYELTSTPCSWLPCPGFISPMLLPHTKPDNTPKPYQLICKFHDHLGLHLQACSLK